MASIATTVAVCAVPTTRRAPTRATTAGKPAAARPSRRAPQPTARRALTVTAQAVAGAETALKQTRQPLFASQDVRPPP
jgi:hypothetical protein